LANVLPIRVATITMLRKPDLERSTSHGAGKIKFYLTLFQISFEV